MPNNTRPEGQGKPKGEEPTPIEEAFRAVRDVQDKGLLLTKENVEGLADSLRQAAIYDASRNGVVREHAVTAAVALSDVGRLNVELARSRSELSVQRVRAQRAIAIATTTVIAMGLATIAALGVTL